MQGACAFCAYCGGLPHSLLHWHYTLRTGPTADSVLRTRTQIFGRNPQSDADSKFGNPNASARLSVRHCRYPLGGPRTAALRRAGTKSRRQVGRIDAAGLRAPVSGQAASDVPLSLSLSRGLCLYKHTPHRCSVNAPPSLHQPDRRRRSCVRPDRTGQSGETGPKSYFIRDSLRASSKMDQMTQTVARPAQ